MLRRALIIALLFTITPSLAFAEDVLKSRDAGPDVSKLYTRGASADDALVTMVMFTDFQCPFCNKAQGTLAELLEIYPDTLRIAHANLPLPFHKDAHLAAQAALAAGEQGKFWAYHDLLFANRKALKRQDLEAYAQQLGLDMAAFNAALDQGTYKARVDAQAKAAGEVGISGTPGFLINGVQVSGAQPVKKFQAVIDEELERAKALKEEKGLDGDALYYALFATAPKAAPKPTPKPAAPDHTRVFVETGDSPVYGDPEAPVTLVVFTDFECPFCQRGATTSLQLVDDHPRQVKLVFKHNPLSFHKNANLAHKASVAAHKQQRFWDYHNLLFANQKALQRDDLIGYAQQLGLDVDRFTAALDAPESQAIIDRDMKDGADASVRGTPHFFMNGVRIKGAQPLSTFEGQLEDELALVDAYLADGVSKANLYETIVEEENKKGPPKVELQLEGAPTRGAEDGAVTLVMFADFQCPFCAKAVPTVEDVLEAYPDDVTLVWKNLPLDFHRDAHLAAQAALEAHAQGKFWPYHELLYTNQKELKRQDLERYAEMVGLDMTAFRAALDNATHEARVDADIKEAKSVGISGTPSFLINGEKFVGAQPLDAFKAKIDAKLKE